MRAQLGVHALPTLRTPAAAVGARRALRIGLIALVPLVPLVPLVALIPLIALVSPVSPVSPVLLVSLTLLVSRVLSVPLVLLVVLVLRVVLLNAPPTSLPCRAGPLTPTAWAPVGHRAGQRNPWSTEKFGHVAIFSTLAQRQASGILRRRPSTPVRHRDYTPPAPSFTGLVASPVIRTPCVKHMVAPAFPHRSSPPDVPILAVKYPFSQRRCEFPTGSCPTRHP